MEKACVSEDTGQYWWWEAGGGLELWLEVACSKYEITLKSCFSINSCEFHNNFYSRP